MSYNPSIGDAYPFQSARGLTGRPLSAPVWHALITAPQKEAKTAHKLEIAGCEVQYPVVTRTRHIRGKRHDFTSPMISQIIYAKFIDQPNWDVMKERRIITGVFASGNIPVVLSENDIARVMGLPTEAERVEQERIEAMTPAVGERVTLKTGPFEGFMVDVSSTERGRVWFESAMGMRFTGEASVEDIQREAG